MLSSQRVKTTAPIKPARGRRLFLTSLRTPQQRPALVRGDCGFGNEPFIAHMEERDQPYLFKLRQSAGVKKLISRKIGTNIAMTRKIGGSDKEQDAQVEILMPRQDVQAWEYAVLVTNSDYPLQAFVQLYRDRAH
jgi:Transposase DDE domain